MNRIYRLVWNKNLNIWTVVSETARGATKKRNVSSSGSSKTTGQQSQNHLLFFAIKFLTAAISIVFISGNTFAGYEAAGGSTNTNCTSSSTGSGSKSAESIAIGTNACAPNTSSIAVGSYATTQSGDKQTNNQSIAIGYDARATGDQAVALGANTRALGASSVAIGGDDVDRLANTKALSDKYTAITGGKLVSGQYPNTEARQGSTAVGIQATAKGDFSTALGLTSKATGDASVALGVQANAEGKGATAIGAVSQATGTGAAAIGINALAKGSNSVAIGSGDDPNEGAVATGEQSVALSAFSKASGSGAVAVGRQSEASKDNAAAYGNEAKASGLSSAAVGDKSSATAEKSLALGASAVASDTRAFAAGADAQALAFKSVALGNNAVATFNNSDTSNNKGTGAIAIGDSSKAMNTGAVSVGRGSFAGRLSVAIGSDAVAGDDNEAYEATAVGSSAKATARQTSAFGHSASASKSQASAFGIYANAEGQASNAFGYQAKSSGFASTAMGTQSEASGDLSTANGFRAKANGNNAVANGSNSKATGNSSVAVGDGAQAQGDNDIAMGRNAATASGNSNNIAVGNGVTTGDTGWNVAMGSDGTTANSRTADGGAVSIGRGQKAAGDGAVAIGDPNSANGDGAVALGRNNTAAGDTAANKAADGAVAIGNENQAIGQGSVAIGNKSKTTEAGSIALGDTADAQAVRGVALGSSAVATNADDVALGAGSKTTTATGAAYRTGTAASSSVVSVGSAGYERRIQNVSAGAADTDAVNVSQLRSVQDGVDELGKSTAEGLGGGSTYDPSTGAVSNPTYNVNGKDVNNVGDAITELDKGWNLQSNGANTGAIKAGDTVDIGTATGEENLTVTKNGNTVQYGLNKDLKVNSVTAGDTVINNDGLSIANGPSVTKSGIDVAGNKISNVAAGTEGTDAVNKDQLDKASQDLTDKGFGLTAQDGTTIQKKLGEAIEVVGADSNITTKVDNGKVAIELAKDLDVNSVKAGDTVINNDGLSIANGPSVTKSGIDVAGNKISNVAAGTEGTDAVNKDQLDKATAALKTEVTEGKNITVTKTTGDNGQDIYNVATADDVEFDSVKVGNVSIDGTTGKISGVTAGDVNPNSTDAINGSQLANNAQSVADALGGGSTVNPDGTVSKPTYNINGTDTNNVGDALAELDKGWTLQSNGANAAAVRAGDTVDIGTADGEENLKVTKEGNDIKYSLNRDLKVNSVTAGDTVINNDGLSIANGPSVTKSGIDVAGNKISNVAAGTEGTDAVNKDQLDKASAASKTEVTEGKNITVTKTTGDNGQDIYNVATADDVEFDSVKVGNVSIDGTTGKISGVTAGDVNPNSTDAINGSQLANNAQSVADALGGGSTVNPDGTVSKPTYNINGTDTNNVGDALAELDKGWTLQSNGANTAAVRAGDTVDIGTADGEENLQVTKEGNDIKYSLNRDLKVNSVTAGDTVINNDGLSIANGPSVTKSGIDVAGNKISNVAAGTEGTDAVNKDQLDKASAASKTEVTEGKNITVTKTTGDNGQDIYNVATADDVEFNNVKVGDVSIDGTTGKISGVTAGDVNPNSTDAINGSQLANNAQSVADALGGGSTVNPDGTVSKPTYNINGTDTNNVGDALAELDKGWTLQSNGANAAAVRAGDTVDIGTADGEENLQVTKEGNDIKYSLNRDLKVNSVTAGDTVINNDGLSITNGPSVTKDGIDAGAKKITNLAAGTVSSDSADAVNGSQLHAQGQGVQNIIGGNTVYDPATGSYTNPDIGGTGENNINDAIGAVGKAAAAAKTEVTEGKNITVTKTTGDDGQDIYNVATADDVEFDSVKVGNVSIDGTTGKISGVTAGDVNPNSTDAINGSQLANNAQSVADALGGGSTVNPDGTVSKPTYNINGTDTNNVGDALAELDKGWTLQSNGANAAAVRAGDTVDIGTADGEENLQVTKEGNDIKYSLNRDLKVNSVAAGDTVINNDGLSITNGPSVTKDGIDAGAKKITNLAAGTVSADSAEAINGSQLHAQGQGVQNIIGGNTVYDPATGSYTNPDIGGTGENNINDAIGAVGKAAAASKTEVTEGKNITVTKTAGDNGQDIYNVATADDVEFDSVKVGNVSIDGTTGKISGVTAGDVNPNSTDAINGSQLANNAQSVADALGGGSTVNPDGTVSKPTYNINGTDTNNVGDALAELDKGWTLQSNGANAAAVRAGDTVDIGTADGEENLQVTKEGNDIKYSLNRDLKVNSVTAGNTRLDNTGVEVKDAVGNSTTIVAGGTVVKDAQGNSTATTATGTTIKNAQGDRTILNGTGLVFTNASDVPVGPSVSRTGIDAGKEKISNVADGEVAAGSKDAVNGGQLNDSVGSVGDIIGGGVTNEGGKLNGPFTVNDKGYDNIADAIAGESAAAKTEVTEGKNINVTKTTGDDGQDIYSVATADDVEFDSVKVGNVSIDGTTGKISGVTAGDVNPNSTDAINGSQLYGVADSVKNAIGGKTVLNPDGSVTTSNVGNTGQNNIHDAIDSVRGQAIAAKTTVKEGENIVVTESKNADGSTNYEVATAKDVKFDSVTATDDEGNETVLNATGTQVKDGEGNEAEYGAKGISLKDQEGKGTLINQEGMSFIDAAGNNIGPSITAGGINAGNTVIRGVAAGRVAADSQEAINGSQLHAQGQGVQNIIGGNTQYDPNTGKYTNADIGGTGKDNINDAIGAVGKAAQEAKTTVTEGKNIVVKEGKNADGSTNYEVSTADDLDVNSLTAGGTKIDGNGLTIEGGPSVTKDGINAGDKKVTGVADGAIAAGSKDAVNGGQLHAQGQGVQNIIGGNTQYDPNTGKYTNADIGGTGKDNINDAIGAVGKAAQAAKSTVSNKDRNIIVKETFKEDGSRDYEVGLAKDISVDSVTAKDVNANQVNVAGDKGTTNITGGGISVTGPKGEAGPSMTTGGINAGDKKVTGVADGAVHSSSKDAINGSQLHQSYQNVGAALGGGAGYDPEKGWQAPSYNVAGSNYNNVGDALGAIDNRVTNLGDQLQQAFYDTNKRMDKLEDKMSAGIAATAALENAPFVPGKLTMAAGAAYYNDQSAIGVTFRRTADNGRWSLTTGAAMGSQGNSPLVRVGVSTVID
ncbi:YadA-like family protein [Acinetobacter sp. C26M]|uniref:ESPR-type extended signal peptide-containing protein n=1 Tax=unclassified Acinetobacter TaxID=196816 RepID=UPI0020372971|nr:MULTISPECIES: ESPR-type extended signal peptide-containing protein [unclassified Acinetobacter]USA47090.1 YadA-like family protein [Acinetobacter sp. C26M]USA50571.1 YadA-like family protein [Acinetobacter sp. C26G]